MYASKLIFVLILTFKLTVQIPQVFQRIETCVLSVDFRVKNRTKSRDITLPSFLNVENDKVKLMVSLCGRIPETYFDGSCGNICVYDKITRSLIKPLKDPEVLYNLENHNTDVIHLKLNTTMLDCEEGEKYEIDIKMMASAFLKRPSLVEISECHFEIQILKPEYTPSCTFAFPDTQLIDLRALETKTVIITDEDETFRLPLCGTDRICGFTASGCKMNKDSTEILGSIDNRRVSVDSQSKTIRIVSYLRYKTGRKLKELEILLKCDWNVPYFSNGKYLKPKGEIGRKYKFEVSSSFGCLKTPKSCVLSDNGLTYDLRSLNKVEGYTVMNGTRLIKLNVCGNLNVKGAKVCKYAQVCGIQGNNYVNLGAVPTLEIVDSTSIRVTFENGGKCNENTNYESIIELKCSFVDEGPLLQPQTDDCITLFEWKTPKACPKFRVENNDECKLSTFLGSLDLNELYVENDYHVNNSQGDSLVFNICGQIHSGCAERNGNVGACLNARFVLGNARPNLTYSDGNLTLTYSERLVIELICSLNERTSLLKTSPERFKVIFHTRSACFYKKFPNCTTASGYDLSPLIGTETNYEISHGNLTFFINICAPLVNTPGMIFTGNSMVYMLNKTEPHLMKSQISLGTIKEPEVIDGDSLVIRTGLGIAACPETGEQATSTIRFECASGKGRPVFLKRDGTKCHFEFLWKTRHACQRDCSINLDSGRTIGLSSDEVNVSIENLVYKFTLCTQVVTRCGSGNCAEITTKRTPVVQNGKLVVQYDFHEPGTICTSRRANFHLECEKNQTFSVTRLGSIENCTFNLLVQTLSVCTFEKQETRTSPTFLNDAPDVVILTTPELEYIDQRCNSINKNAGNFSLSEIEPKTVLTKNNEYRFNFNGNGLDVCKGMICKNNRVVLPFTNCPIFLEMEHSFKLLYKVEGICDNVNFDVSLLLKCNRTRVQHLNVLNEGDCLLDFEFDSEAICAFLNEMKGWNSTGLAIAIVVIFVAITCIVLTAFYKRTIIYECWRPRSYETVLVEHSKLM